MTQDNIKEYVVCINGGSGVAFQPTDEHFTYILTAKHVLEDVNSEVYNERVNVHYYNHVVGGFETLESFPLMKGVNYFEHSNLDVDIAILKIPRINCKNNLLIKDNYVTDNANYSLVGFPLARRDRNPINKNWIRHDNELTVLQEKEFKRREADISKNQNWDELVGSSGGGIFKIIGDSLFIIGIQNKVPNERENLGRIEFTPIKFFNDIVIEAEGLLEEIIPFHLKQFRFLRNEAFLFDVDVFQEEDIEHTKSYLRNKALNVIRSGITPFAIKSFFNQRLLVDEYEYDTLSEKRIWSTWLEFLTIMNIIKYESFGEQELFEIFNSFRLKYSNTEKDWTHLLKNQLLYSDYHGLKLGGKVFVQTKGPSSSSGALIIPKDRIRNITRVYDSEKLKTDNAIHPYTHYDFFHVDYLKKECIVKKLDKYKSLNSEEELFSALKEEYNELFR